MDNKTLHTKTKSLIKEEIVKLFEGKTKREKAMLNIIADQIQELECPVDYTKEPNYLIINHQTNETEETLETLKEAIQLHKPQRNFIWDNIQMKVVSPSYY